MTNRHTTKRALLLSVMSMLLCITMLMGTTFAWFTDTATSSGNKIVAGTLKVDLEVLGPDNTTWTSVKEDNAAIFNYTNWEPGYTEVKILRVVNKGSLALKWYAKLVSANVLSDLANVIDVYVKEDVTGYPTVRDDLTGWTSVGTLADFVNTIETTTTGEIQAKAAEETEYPSEVLGIAFKMQETAGNEYQGMSLGEFDINIFATQLAAETDSFGKEYDAAATYESTVTTYEELKAALAEGGYITLGDNITGDDGTTLSIDEGTNATLNLNGKTFTNAVASAPALTNNGTLTIEGTGAIVNGVSDTRGSHTIVNNGTLIIKGGNIGTDDTAGAAVMNYGTTTIDGGTFASKQENVMSDGLCAYAFINQSGTMTINNAMLNGQTHGLFGAYGGEIVVNGGNYTLDGNGGLGCYVVYATGEAKVTLGGGIINTNSPRHNRVFYVYDNGNYFNAAAVATGKVVVNGATIYLNGVEQSY